MRTIVIGAGAAWHSGLVILAGDSDRRPADTPQHYRLTVPNSRGPSSVATSTKPRPRGCRTS